MEILDFIKNILSNAKALKNVALPQEIQNMQKLHANIKAQIEEVEQNGLPQTAQAKMRLGSLRNTLFFHYKHLRQGGEVSPREAYKMHPAFIQMKREYPSFNERLTKLEKQHLGCTFGYQMPDGSIRPPELDWSDEELKNIEKQSLHQTARLWYDNDKSQYLC